MTLPRDPSVPLPATSAGREVLSESDVDAAISQLRMHGTSSHEFEASVIEALRLQLQRVTQEKDELRQRCEERERRLEIHGHFQWSQAEAKNHEPGWGGDWIDVPFDDRAERDRYPDGVFCRDATIDGQDESIAALKARAERAEADLLRVRAEKEQLASELDAAEQCLSSQRSVSAGLQIQLESAQKPATLIDQGIATPTRWSW